MATVNLDLIAPTVVGAANGLLEPHTIPESGVVVQVPAYGGRAVNQWVCVVFNGQGGSKEVTDRLQVTDVSSVMAFAVSKAEVFKNINQAVTFEYKVALTDGAIYTTSDPVSLKVGYGDDRPGETGFEHLPIGPIYAPMDFGIVSLESIRPQARIDVSDRNPSPPYITGKHIVIERLAGGSQLGIAIFKLRRPCKKIKVGIACSKRISFSVVRYNGSEYWDFTQSIEAGARWIEYDVGSANLVITGFEVNVGDSVKTCSIDNILLEY